MTIRTPFFRRASGKARRTNRSFFHGVRRNDCAATTQVMNSAVLDRMPLHSFATSIVTPGTVRKSLRNTGTSRMRNRKYATG